MQNSPENASLSGVQPAIAALRHGLIAAAVAGGVMAVSGGAWAEGRTRAAPFAAWPDPTIVEHLTVEKAKEIVAQRSKPQTEWLGPTNGPRASSEPITIAWVSGDESYATYIGWVTASGLRQRRSAGRYSPSTAAGRLAASWRQCSRLWPRV
jgi:hypothetical protein